MFGICDITADGTGVHVQPFYIHAKESAHWEESSVLIAIPYASFPKHFLVFCSNVQVGLRLSTRFMHCTPLWYCRVCVSFNNGTILFILHFYDTMLHSTQCLLLLHTAVSIN